MPQNSQYQRWFRLLGFLSSLVLLPALAGAADLRVLFIGNSFTQGSPVPGGVPELFDRLARAGGQGDPLTIMSAAGGTDFRYHTTNAATRTDLASQSWTHVILQNYSTEPTHLVDGTHSLANHFTYGTKLYELVLSNSPRAQVVLYETWSRAVGHSLITGVSNASGYASTAEFQEELRANYQRLAADLNAAHPAAPPVIVAPVGSAWESVGGLRAAADPRFVRLHGSDLYHGNESGYYLAAAVFYSRVFGVSPRGLSQHPLLASLNLPFTTDPSVLEEAAWAAVTNSGAGLPLTLLREPVSQTVAEDEPVAFSVVPSGAPPYWVQWLNHGIPIPDAVAFVLQLPAASPDLDGTVFTVTVSNAFSRVTSSNAILTVVADTRPPILEAVETTEGRQLSLRFDGRMDEASVVLVAHYSVTSAGLGDVPVETAVLQPDGRTVLLNLGLRLSGPFTVTAHHVRDRAGNENVAGTTFPGMAPVLGPLTLLIDFGAAGTVTTHGPVPDDPALYWNNVADLGTTTSGQLNALVTAQNQPTAIGLVMLSRFNGANANGTLASSLFPAEATRDSLFGNTETFSGLANVFPAFKLTGLDRELTYNLTFYASRTGVNDNRETLYTVVGAQTNSTVLNAANNITNTARLLHQAPGAAGELAIHLQPGPRNNNANHFTYLGVLRVDLAEPRFTAVTELAGQILLEWIGGGQLEWAPLLTGPWTRVLPGPASFYVQAIEPGLSRFFRLTLGP